MLRSSAYPTGIVLQADTTHFYRKRNFNEKARSRSYLEYHTTGTSKAARSPRGVPAIPLVTGGLFVLPPPPGRFTFAVTRFRLAYFVLFVEQHVHGKSA